MSNQRHRSARLTGYQGPHFTIATEALAEQLDTSPVGTITWFRLALEKVVDLVIPANRLVTSDDYQWYCGLVVLQGNAIVLIPKQGDATRRDGTTRDRAIALYIKLGTNLNDANKVILQVKRAVLVQQAKDRRAFQEKFGEDMPG